MKKSAIVIKEPGSSAQFGSVDESLAGLQSIVGGHVESLTLLREGVNRITIIMRDMRAGLEHNVNVNGHELHGTIILCKHNGAGDLTNLDERERAAWVEWLDRDDTDAPATGEVNDSMQVMVIPRHVDSESGDELEPSEIIGRLMAQFDREWEDMPPAEFPEVYQAALLAMHKQDHEFKVIDDETYLLGFPDADGEQKFLRVIRFTDSEPIVFTTMQEFSDYWDTNLNELSDEIRQGHIGEFDLKIFEGSVELNGLPLELPFSDHDWLQLVRESEGATQTVESVE